MRERSGEEPLGLCGECGALTALTLQGRNCEEIPIHVENIWEEGVVWEGNGERKRNLGSPVVKEEWCGPTGSEVSRSEGLPVKEERL